jgi:hypothetical protein
MNSPSGPKTATWWRLPLLTGIVPSGASANPSGPTNGNPLSQMTASQSMRYTSDLLAVSLPPAVLSSCLAVLRHMARLLHSEARAGPG